MKTDNIMKELNKKDLINISGGHEGWAYTAGEAAADFTLSVLGFFASIAVGIDQGMK